MERIWAPWRMEYIQNGDNSDTCLFCLNEECTSDQDRLVLYRSTLSLVMLNKYPYTNGHLLIAPRRHTSEIDSLSDGEMLDLFSTLRRCKQVLQQTARPEGFNIGMNLGKSAGAGVVDHMHIHIVPRWNGDTNFMTVIPDVRIMPENLSTTYIRLLPYFNTIDPEFA